MDTVKTALDQVIEHGIDGIDGLFGQEVEAGDLHHHLYNEDYFIIGYYNAEQFLNQYGTFQAIEEVQEYEKDNFGECTTDLGDSEKVANMFAYIKGEDALNNCPTLQKHWDDKLTDKQLKQIQKELKAQM